MRRALGAREERVNQRARKRRSRHRRVVWRSGLLALVAGCAFTHDGWIPPPFSFAVWSIEDQHRIAHERAELRAFEEQDRACLRAEGHPCESAEASALRRERLVKRQRSQ